MDESRRKQARTTMANSMRTMSARQQQNITATDLQKMIRIRFADASGLVRCVTCDRQHHWKRMHGGHFIAGRNSGAVLDPRNVWPQCAYCNKHLSGNQGRYAEFMLATFGQEVIDELRLNSSKGRTWPLDELLDLREFYRAEIRKHEERLSQ